VLRAAVFAAIGPLTLAAASPGAYWIGDLMPLLAMTTAMSVGVVVLRRLIAAPLDPAAGSAIDLVVIGALTLPFLVVLELSTGAPPESVPRVRVVLAITVLVALALIIAILRSRTLQSRAVAIVTTAAIVSVGWSSARIARHEILLRRDLAQSPTAQRFRSWDADSAVRTWTKSSRPNVFLVILDAYGSDSLLQAKYGINHRALRGELAALGFTEPSAFSSNYSRTFASVSSMLNFDHVFQIERESVGGTQHAGFLHALIRDNRTVRMFRAAGYTVHWMPAPLFAGRRLPPADAVVHQIGGSPFARLWMNSILIHTWLQKVSTLGILAQALGYRFDLSPAFISGMELLPALAANSTPTLAIVHVFAVHGPLLYDRTCGVHPAGMEQYGEAAAYANAVGCLDAAMVRVFRTIIARAGDHSIIVAVGDHGPQVKSFAGEKWPSASTPVNLAKAPFEAASFVYLPPSIRSEYTAPRTMVNLIPSLLQAIFGARMGRRPDDLFFSKPPPDQIYHFAPVTRR
jgi:hypothetical protein